MKKTSFGTLEKRSDSQGLTLLLLILAGCAGPTSPFGGVHPWDLTQSAPEASTSEVLDLSSNIANFLALPVGLPLEEDWAKKLSRQNSELPWVLMDPEHINYTRPEVLRIYIHDPGNTGHRPLIRLTYDDWDLTAKIRDSANWHKISATDWQFTSAKLKFSPARVGELRVSFLAKASKKWVSTQLLEPHCRFANQEGLRIQQTGRFSVPPELLAQIESLSHDSKINPNLVAGLIAQESGFNIRAVSMSKALGLTQVTPLAEKEVVARHPEYPQFPGLNDYSFLRLLTLIKTEEIGPHQEWRLDPAHSIVGGITFLELEREYWNRFANSSAGAGGTPPLLRSPAREAVEKSLNKRSLTEQDKMLLLLASYNSGAARVKRAYLQNRKMWLKDESLSEARVYVHKISSYCSQFAEAPAQKKGE